MNPKIYKYLSEVNECELLVLAAGFEERAFQFLSKSRFSKNAYCILVKFDNDTSENQRLYLKYKDRIIKSFDNSNFFEVTIIQDKPQDYEHDLASCIQVLPHDVGDAWIDISGMPTYAICSTLSVLRTYYNNRKQVIIYTAAKSYFPTFDEYNILKTNSNGPVEFLPKSMAKEMAEILLLKTFSGHRSKEGVSCLAVIAGYDSPRSAGVIESINPSILLLLYGKPANPELSWRLDLSRELHKRFESTRRAAIEEVSTLDLTESITILENYYEYLFDDYDFIISPICSKMQVVGVFLFWERYKEVQLVFPLPVEYDIERCPRDSGNTYITYLKPRNSLYHSI